MNKSIYEETLDILDDILVDSFSDPQDEYNDCYMLDFKQIIKIEKAIKKAQEQEKLLQLYRRLVNQNLQVNLHILEKIKEIENE